MVRVGALAEGKGHAENAPWTTYSQSTNDGNRWGHWRGTQPMALLLVAPTQLPQAPPSMATSSNGQPLSISTTVVVREGQP